MEQQQQPAQQQPTGGVPGPTGRRLHIAHRRSPSELTPLMSMFANPGSKSAFYPTDPDVETRACRCIGRWKKKTKQNIKEHVHGLFAAKLIEKLIYLLIFSFFSFFCFCGRTPPPPTLPSSPSSMLLLLLILMFSPSCFHVCSKSLLLMSKIKLQVNKLTLLLSSVISGTTGHSAANRAVAAATTADPGYSSAVCQSGHDAARPSSWSQWRFQSFTASGQRFPIPQSDGTADLGPSKPATFTSP